LLVIVLSTFQEFSWSQTSQDTTVEISRVPRTLRKIVVSLGEPDTSQYKQPSPVIGWDSLAKSIGYPELARRSELEGCYTIEVLITPDGIVKSIGLDAVPDVFKDSIDRAFQSTRWLPAIWFGERIEWRMKLPVIFVLRGYGRGSPLLIEAEKNKKQPVKLE